MQLRHVSTNLGQGLRRNLSMHLAVVLTLFVSLTLAGIGLMLTQQATLTEEVLGNELQIQVYLCVPDEKAFPQCTSEVSESQKAAIEKVVEDNPEVKSHYFESKETAFEKVKLLLGAEQFEGPDPVLTAKDLPQSIWITLVNADEYVGVVSAVEGLDGVRNIETAREVVGPVFSLINQLKYASWGAAAVLILSAVLLVGNTIRLAAMARRKEIEIMRLVGASRIFIALPFLLEALVTALVGVVLAVGALAGFTEFAIIRGVDEQFNAIPFVAWPEFFSTALLVAIAGPVLTVIPTLLLTRKYLRL